MTRLYTFLKAAALILGFWLGIHYAKADDIGLRYNNYVDSSGLFNFQPAGQKLLEAKYDWDATKWFYVEGATGEYFANDFNQATSLVAEISPGVKVQAGPVVFKVSQGMVCLPWVVGQSTIQFITHISLAIEQSDTGVSLGLERTHISNGDSSSTSGLNFTGIVLSKKL